MAFSTKSVTTESLKFHIMDEETFNEIESLGNIKENELYLVEGNDDNDNDLNLDPSQPIPLTSGGTGVSVSSVAELKTVLSVADRDHTSYDKTCGIGNELKYGHVKLSDDYDSTSDASEGVAATPKAVKQLHDLINELTELINSKADINSTGTIASNLIGYGEIVEWSDGNKTAENRIGYFVATDTDKSTANVIKAKSSSNIRGVTVEKPGFTTSAGEFKFDTEGNLLPKYSYILNSGIVSVIDDGNCVVGGTCMCNDAGIAIPSTNNMGYRVIERNDTNRITIYIEPQGHMMVNLKEDINNKQDVLMWATMEDIDAMIAGNYNPETIGGVNDNTDDLVIFLVRE